MEGMTELINDTFLEDLSPILSSCVEGKPRKTFFEMDKEFESMTVVKSMFVSLDSFLLFMWVLLRQTLIHMSSLWIKKNVDETRGPLFLVC